MRRALLLIFALLLPNLFFLPHANAIQEIVITEPTHRLSDGVFIDDQLARKLSPNGELGLLVFSSVQGVRSWQVDPATISEIVAMSNGYGISDGSTPVGQQIAKEWLAQFIRVSKNEKVTALTYGNPSAYWVDQIINQQITYIDANGKILLETVLGKATNQSLIKNRKRQGLSKQNINLLNYAQRQIDLLGTLVDQKELLSYQLRLAQILNPDIEKSSFQFLIKDYDKSITELRNKLKVTKTRFTVTSTKEELPITLVNDFDQSVDLKLSVRALNSKVVVASTQQIRLEAKSKQQVLLPIEVLASGESSLLAQLTNLENKPIGYPVNINLKLSVISPVATWITSGAAVLLFVAAIIQSIRRVRRRK
uniref:DUF6049 family protein n=1 Tax=Candidatus Nanopelagicus sp. TaxID=2518620 RepID=UPI00404B6F8E